MRYLALLLLLLAAPALAEDYYVRTDGAHYPWCDGLVNAPAPGSCPVESRPCACAWLTVESCATSADVGDGDRCLIQAGTYPEDNFTQANAGVLESDNLLSDCTCTKGSSTISCGTSIPGTVGAQDFVMCEIPGTTFTGWAWTEVASVAGTTITLTEGYKGESVASTGVLDVARFVQFIGQGATPTDVVLTHWGDEPADVAWTIEAGTSCVYSYTFSSTADSLWANSAPKGFRDSAPSYAQWNTQLPPNGKDAYIKLEGDYGDCPCGDGRTIAQNVDTVPGSWASDGNKVYLHVRGTDTDGDGTLTGNCIDPDTVQIQRAAFDGLASALFTANKSYTIIDNMTFEAGIANTASDSKVVSSALSGPGTSSWLLSDVQINSGVLTTLTSTAVNLVRYEHLTLLNGWVSTTFSTAQNSDLSFYDIEVRGNVGNLVKFNALRGTSASDRVLFERMWIHNNWTNMVGNGDGIGGNCNAQAATYNCTTKQFTTEYNRFRGNHCVYMGSVTDNTQVFTNIMFRNNVIDMCTDGVSFFAGDGGTTPSTDIWLVNNTLGANSGASNERLKIGGGTNSNVTSGIVNVYNNVSMCPSSPSGCSGDGNFVWYGTGVGHPFTADYNTYLDTAYLAIGGSPRVWKSGETFDVIRGASYGAQEAHGVLVCGSGCSSATGGTVYNDGLTGFRLTDIVPSDGDGVDYTPLGTSRLINTGAATYCPTEDFYGNPRSDGQCDIGAIEYQTANKSKLLGTKARGVTVK